PAIFRLASAPGQYESQPWLRTSRNVVLPSSSAPGHYLLTVQPGSEDEIPREPKIGCSMVPISINHSARESDLRCLSQEELAASLSGSRDAVIRTKLNSDVILSDLRSGRDLWRFALLAALVLLGAESLVAWRTHSEAAG
ncbi:MAG TPA: hypothetical protein VEK08_19420, partial [Planctomycetota bacterium]|nr:hypothetical protein [Planctomycetota bacterium]